MTCILLWASAARAQNTHDVTALVGGQSVTIGTITATIGINGTSGSEQTAFTFNGGWGSLDSAYDFHWVQIIQQCGTVTFTGYNGTQTFSTATAPFVDAPPNGYDYEADLLGKPGDDTAPFYEHEDTTKTPGGGTFATSYSFRRTHTEGVSSRLSDNPSLGPNGGLFQAVDFLVVTAPEQNGRFTPGTLDVLGGYSWTENFGTGGAATPGGPVFTDADPALVNQAMSTSGFASTWQAVTGVDLLAAPEPSALLALLTGTLSLLVLSARRPGTMRNDAAHPVL